jgi:hypothetical protein
LSSACWSTVPPLQAGIISAIKRSNVAHRMAR